ncbi:MAG: hypothetical protein AB8F26_13025 [Phycisphaerales bacterium]
MIQVSPRRTSRLLSLVVLALGVMSMPGCYTRVTKAKGIGADYSHPDRYESSKPKIDQLLDNAAGRQN